MEDLPYRLEPAPGYQAFKVTSLLRDYLELQLKEEENQEHIDQIMKQIVNYIEQLKKLRTKNPNETLKQVYKATDDFFNKATEESKAGITCKAGCTFCCYIDVDISGDEADLIIEYCKMNEIEIDKAYLNEQDAVGRSSYSALSRCVFLKNNLCTIYPVRPIACRKHWVKTDPVLCDFSNNIINQVGGYFDVNTEILASALLNVEETGPFERVLLTQLEKQTNP